MTTPFTHHGPDQLGRERWTVTLKPAMLAAATRIDQGHGVLLTWDDRGHQIAPLDAPFMEQLVAVLTDGGDGRNLGPQLATALARLILDAGDWRPRGQPTAPAPGPDPLIVDQHTLMELVLVLDRVDVTEPGFVTRMAQAVLEAGTWTPADDPTSTDLIHAALNYHGSEIEGNRDATSTAGTRGRIRDAFTEAVNNYRNRHGLDGADWNRNP